MRQALLVMTEKRWGVVGVTDEAGRLVGAITDGDLRRFLQNKQPVHGTVVNDVMTPNPKTIQEDRLAFEAYMTMSDHKITQLVVRDQRDRPAPFFSPPTSGLSLGFARR